MVTFVVWGLPSVGLSVIGEKLAPLHFDRSKLMHMWRYAVITYLRAALKKGVLASEMRPEDLSRMLKQQYERWWNIYVNPIKSKWHFCDM